MRHYRKPLTVAIVAKALCVSPRQLQRAYALVGESTFREDLIAERMRNAIRLLSEYPAIPISDVGRLVGYSQGPHFSRAFRRRYGLTPARFRQQAVAQRQRALRDRAQQPLQERAQGPLRERAQRPLWDRAQGRVMLKER